MLASSDFDPDRDIGQRLLLNHIDECASRTPDKIVFYQVLCDGPREKVVPITYICLRNLIDQLAWWLDGLRPKNRKDDTPIAYLGPSDLRHLILSLACNRIGSKGLLLSPRNSAQIDSHLINECGCDLLIFDPACYHAAEEISARSNVSLHALDDLVDLLERKNARTKKFPYHETWTTAFTKPALILQTSGSTGPPKPVPITHAALAAIDIQRSTSTEYGDGRKCHLEVLVEAKRPYQSFPLFHVAGFELTSLFLFARRCVVLGPPRRPPGIEIYRKVVELTRPDAAMLAPQIVNEIAEDKVLMSAVVPKLEWIMYGGGAITESAGNTICSRTRLMNGFGSTECGSIPLYPTHAPYWDCYHFHPLSGVDLRPVPDSDGLYELFIVRDESKLPYQAVFQIFPHLEEFHTKDIFRRHPDNEDYWVYQGRMDDIVVLATGEKVNPLPIQDTISAIPGVRAALVVGNQQPYPGLLVDLEFDAMFEDSKDVLMNRLDKRLATMNDQGSRDANIEMQDVIWANPQKPLARNAKGNLRRNTIEQDYRDEINRMYEKVDDGLVYDLEPSSEETLSSGILEMSKELVARDDLTVDTDLFESGLDSRGAQLLVTIVNRALLNTGDEGSRDTRKDVSVDIVYKHPTVERLAGALFQYIHSSDTANSTELESRKMLQKHVDNLSSLPPRMHTKDKPAQNAHVLLTGSTGFVGSYVLDTLSRCTEVERITCIDRWTESRAPASNTIKTQNSVEVEQLLGGLDQDNFNLDTSMYSALLDSVTVILHCQWPVNFNQPLSSFEPNIQGVENLARFAHAAKYNPRVIFLSSIAAVKRWDQGVPVPEKPLSNPNHAQTGYGQSKLLASLLLEEAGKSIGIRSTICRLGQVAGPVGSIVQQKTWPRMDWFPALLDASRSMGCIPDSLGTANRIDWIPVDKLADTISEIVVSERPIDEKGMPLTNYYHLVNPEPTRYQEFLPIIARRLGDVTIVSLTEWVGRLEESAATAGEVSNPGLSLLGFFQNLESTQAEPPVVMETKHTQEQVRQLNEIGAVNGTWMESWLDQWDIKAHN